MSSSRTTARLAFVVLAISLALPRASAHADRSSVADRHLSRGLEYYGQQRYERAIAQFERGYAVEPRREFLFALGQAARLSGDCATAVTYYRQFLSRNPPARQVQATWEHLGSCDRALGTRRVEAKAAAPPPPVAAAAVTASVHVRGQRPWYRDPVGTSLLGASVVCLGTSMAMFVSASNARDSARLAPTYDAFDELADRARARRNLGITFGVAAGALGGAAIYRLVWGRPRADTRLELTPRAGGASVSVGVGF